LDGLAPLLLAIIIGAIFIFSLKTDIYMNEGVCLHVFGEYACFIRPEFKGERDTSLFSVKYSAACCGDGKLSRQPLLNNQIIFFATFVL
jgi:hypothetical protein